MRFIRLIIDLFFLTRPVVLVPVWGFSLFGYRIASKNLSFFSTITTLDFLKIVLFSLSVAAVYVANQIEDFEVDSDNGGIPLLVKTDISKRSATIFAILLAILSITIPTIFGFINIAIFTLVAIIIGYLYSFKPFYFTGRPILDFISNGLGYGVVAYLVGYSIGGGEINSIAFLSSVPYLFMMFAGSISSTLPDFVGDKKHGKVTTAVFWGKMNAHILATIFLLISIVSALYFNDNIALISSALALPFYLLYIIKPIETLEEATYKVGGGVSMVIIGIYFPLFILVGAVVAVMTVIYFRLAFNLSYPSLLPVSND